MNLELSRLLTSNNKDEYISYYNKNNKLIFSNEYFIEKYKRDSELSGKDLKEIYTDEKIVSSIIKAKDKAIKNGGEERFVECIDDETYEFKVSVSKIDGEIEGYIVKEYYINKYEVANVINASIPNVMYVKGINGQYFYFNENFAEKFFKQKNIAGKTLLELVDDEDFVDKISDTKNDVISNNGVTFKSYDFYDDSKHYIGVIQFPLLDARKDPWAIIGVYVDAAEYVKKQRSLEKKAYCDQLTGTFNRSYFFKIMEEVQLADRYPCTLIMGDVNGLKIVNDSLGHIEGDKMLKHIADILKQSCRSGDSIFRWGGDEFVIVLPNTKLENTEILINRINENCAKASETGVPLSISLGAAELHDEDTDINETLTKAEEILYKNKMPDSTSEYVSPKLQFLEKLMDNKLGRRERYIGKILEYSMNLGELMHLTDSKLEQLKLAVMMSDLGKVGLSDSLLEKPMEKFTEEDIKEYKKHVDSGYRIAKSIQEIEHVSRDILCQYENWDGSGYPQGLVTSKIPVNSRIIAIASEYYLVKDRKKLDDKAIKQHFIDESGKRFDPKMTQVFIENIDKM